jgi:hypothetical protein
VARGETQPNKPLPQHEVQRPCLHAGNAPVCFPFSSFPRFLFIFLPFMCVLLSLDKCIIRRTAAWPLSDV